MTLSRHMNRKPVPIADGRSASTAGSRLDSATMRELVTTRLTLRPYRMGDLDLIASLYEDAEVTAYTKLGRRTRAESEAILQTYVDLWNTREFGMWAMFRRVDDAFVGECGVFLLATGEAALRYALPKSAWGQGFAPEAVQATTDDLFARAAVPHLLSIVQARNTSSRRVMEKAGWRVDGTGRDGDLELLIYRLSREHWQRRVGQASADSLQQ